MCLVYVRRCSRRHPRQSRENTRRRTSPVWTAPPTKGDAILAEHAWLAKKHDDCSGGGGSEGRKYNREKSPLEDKYRSSWVKGDKQKNGVSFNKKKSWTAEIILRSPSQQKLAGHCLGNKQTHSAVLLSSAAGQQLTQPLEAQMRKAKVNFWEHFFKFARNAGLTG